MGADTLASSRLRRLAQRSAGAVAQAEADAQEHCDLCSAPIPAEHQHVLDLSSRQLKCSCRPCALLFDSKAAGGGHYRLIPDRRLRIDDFELDDALWEGLRIPVDMAFFFRDTQAERVSTFYPSPMGATESLLELRAWTELERANPVVGTLTPDVEALLVNRARGESSHWIVPVDDCYDLVGLIRTRWRGLTGGTEVWQAIEQFFERLAGRAKHVTRTGERTTSNKPGAEAAGAEREVAAWPAA